MPAHARLVGNLNRASLHKRFDAYLDVPWDAPEMAIDPRDPRFELPADHPLGATPWYRALPPNARARLGLHMLVAQLRLGIEFEGVLSRGLLGLMSTLEPERDDARYVLHEVIEEAQHSLMFRELIVRSGLPTQGLTGLDRWSSNRVPTFARTFPELFFVFVLGGEAPIDHAQRATLRRGAELHPLVARVMRIHVTEEARHICFAESWLRREVPHLGPLKRRLLAWRAPVVLSMMANQMLRPTPFVIRTHRIPRTVLRAAYVEDPRHRETVRAGLAPVRAIFDELNLRQGLGGWLWRGMGISEAPRASVTSFG